MEASSLSYKYEDTKIENFDCKVLSFLRADANYRYAQDYMDACENYVDALEALKTENEISENENSHIAKLFKKMEELKERKDLILNKFDQLIKKLCTDEYDEIKASEFAESFDLRSSLL